KQIEEHKRRWSLPGEKIHARCGGMQAQLQRVEVQPVVPDDDNFSVGYAASRQRRGQRPNQLRKVAGEVPFLATPEQELMAIATYQGAKSIPLGLKNPVSIGGQFIHTPGQHGQNRRIHGKVHASWYDCALQASNRGVSASRQYRAGS